MPKYVVPFTKTGFEQFKKEYEDLQNKRPEFVHNLSVARDMGDRSENAAYKEARRKLSSTDSRLRFLKRILEHAEVRIPTNTDTVQIGTTVTVYNGSQDITYHIVGEHEADPMNKKLSYKSPVGNALRRRTVGEVVSVELPVGIQKYTIKEIRIES